MEISWSFSEFGQYSRITVLKVVAITRIKADDATLDTLGSVQDTVTKIIAETSAVQTCPEDIQRHILLLNHLSVLLVGET